MQSEELCPRYAVSIMRVSYLHRNRGAFHIFFINDIIMVAQRSNETPTIATSYMLSIVCSEFGVVSDCEMMAMTMCPLLFLITWSTLREQQANIVSASTLSYTTFLSSTATPIPPWTLGQIPAICQALVQWNPLRPAHAWPNACQTWREIVYP